MTVCLLGINNKKTPLEKQLLWRYMEKDKLKNLLKTNAYILLIRKNLKI